MEVIRKSPRRKGLGQRGLGPVVGCGGKENWYGSQMRLRSKGRKGGKGPESRNPWPGFRGTKKWRSGLELGRERRKWKMAKPRTGDWWLVTGERRRGYPWGGFA